MKTFIFFASLVLSLRTYAHGEDKAGPHGGFVRMPGAYHTEVVPSGSFLKIYLLDMNWKNPSTQNSSVEIVFSAESPQTISCSREKEYFKCPVSKKIRLEKSGKLVVRSQREGQKGNEATYPLPLKLEKAADSHEGHH